MATVASTYRSNGLTEAEIEEEARRLAQLESEVSITMSAEEKAARDRAAKEKKRRRRKKKRDPNAPRGGDFAVDGTTGSIEEDGFDLIGEDEERDCALDG